MENEKRKGILLVGEPMGLFMAQQEGQLEDVSGYDIAVAGAELNVSIGLSRLGHKVSYVTKLGRDFIAKVIVRLMDSAGISTEFTTFSDDRPSGIMFKSLTPGGDPDIFYMRKGAAASTLSPADIDAIDFSEYGHVHMTGIAPALSDSTRAAAARLFERAREEGITISFDPNLRPQLWPSEQAMIEFMNSSAAKADFVLPGAAEGRLLMGKADATPEEIADFYLGLGARCAIVKVGSKGAYFSNGTESGWGTVYPAEKVVDTVGAGDGFAAGFISAMMEGLPLIDCVSRGNAVGSMQVQVRGDNEGLPTREQLSAFMGAEV